MFKKIFKFIGYFTATIILLVCLIILFSGRWYLYKGLWYTYLSGRSGPSATEYQIFENRKVEALDPKPIPRSKFYNSSELPKDAETIFRNFDAHAFVVTRNDSLIHEQYWDGYGDTSHTNGFSIAKTYCSVLLGCALKDGFIKSLDEPVSKYISEFATGEKSKITLRHLVTMTSGIAFDESYISPFAY